MGVTVPPLAGGIRGRRLERKRELPGPLLSSPLARKKYVFPSRGTIAFTHNRWRPRLAARKNERMHNEQNGLIFSND